MFSERGSLRGSFFYVALLGMKRILLTVFILIQAAILLAQEQDRLNELTVDRPGIAEAPFTVSPGMFQFETGFDYYKRTTGEVYFLPVTPYFVEKVLEKENDSFRFTSYHYYRSNWLSSCRFYSANRCNLFRDSESNYSQ